MEKIKVLIVDDSAFMRRLLSDILSSDPVIDVVHKARNGLEAVEKASELHPDVITMDVEMPVMDGIEALQNIMEKQYIPIIMLSSSTSEGASSTIHALELGAIDFIQKPSGQISLDINKVETEIIEKVKMAAMSRKGKPLERKDSLVDALSAKISEHAPASFYNIPKRKSRYEENLVLIGCSTGGPRALQILLKSFPADFPAPILIVQHMPPGFTKSLSQRLDAYCSIHVVEAMDAALLEKGTAYIAPGDFHMEVVPANNGKGEIVLTKNAPKSGHRPSVDVLFEAVSRLISYNKYAVILTGMGTDGTKGLGLLKAAGCSQIIAEAESTCVVYGMPKSAIQSGYVDKVLPIEDIGPYIVHQLRNDSASI